jgi:hypothetical protein
MRAKEIKEEKEIKAAGLSLHFDLHKKNNSTRNKACQQVAGYCLNIPPHRLGNRPKLCHQPGKV